MLKRTWLSPWAEVGAIIHGQGSSEGMGKMRLTRTAVHSSERHGMNEKRDEARGLRAPLLFALLGTAARRDMTCMRSVR